MTVKELIQQLQQRFELHLKDEEDVYLKTDHRLTEVEEFNKTLKEWINWALKIILLSILVALLSLVIKSAA